MQKNNFAWGREESELFARREGRVKVAVCSKMMPERRRHRQEERRLWKIRFGQNGEGVLVIKKQIGIRTVTSSKGGYQTTEKCKGAWIWKDG